MSAAHDTAMAAALAVRLGANRIEIRTTATARMVTAVYGGSARTATAPLTGDLPVDRLESALARKKRGELTGYPMSGSRGRQAAG